MTMKLYRVVPLPAVEYLIVAPTTTKAIEIFVANAGIGDPREPSFVVEEFNSKIPDHWKTNLDDVLASGVSGLASFDEDVGWSVDP